MHPFISSIEQFKDALLISREWSRSLIIVGRLREPMLTQTCIGRSMVDLGHTQFEME